MTYAANKRYKNFIKCNNANKGGAISTLLSYDNASGLCIYRAADNMTIYIMSVKILISDVYNNMVYIENASKLNSWYFWESPVSCNDMYPNDYFDSPKEKYVVDITDEFNPNNTALIYEKYKNILAC